MENKKNEYHRQILNELSQKSIKERLENKYLFWLYRARNETSIANIEFARGRYKGIDDAYFMLFGSEIIETNCNATNNN